MSERKYKDYQGYRIYDDGRFQNIERGTIYKPQKVAGKTNPFYIKYKYIQHLNGSIKDMVYINFVGPIPRGWKVINIDGDSMNCKVENLKLIHVISESIRTAKKIEDIIGIQCRREHREVLYVSAVSVAPILKTRNGKLKKVYPALSYPGTRCKETAIARHTWLADHHRKTGEYPPQYKFIEKFNMYLEIEEYTLKGWEQDYIPRDFLADQIGHCNFKECTKSEACYSVIHKTRTPLADPARKGQKWKYKQATTFYKDNEVFAAY
jgi:hypothetical protein